MSDRRMHPLEGIQRQDIKITDLEVIPLSYRLKPEEQWPDGDQHFVVWQTTTVLVKLHTNVGLVGIGGASRYSGPERMMAYAEQYIKPFLLGKNPFDVEFLAAAKCGHGARAVWAGVDTAMWDIIGRAVGRPVYELLAIDNEPETHLRVYASGGEYGWKPGTRFDGPDSLIEKAARHKANGYTAFKFRPGAGFGQLGITMERYIPYLYRIREAVGPDFDLIQESNCRWSVEQCLEVAPVLEELGFLWWEEPTRKWDDDSIDKYLQIKAALKTVKVSGAEGLPNRGAMAEWVDRGAYDIVQQGADDAGLTEAWYMARMAHERGIICCPHNWQGGLVTIANAHLMAAIPNRLMLESNMTPNPLKEGLFKETLAVKDGYLDVPDRPGLGVTLRDDLEERFPYLPGPWHLPDDQV